MAIRYYDEAIVYKLNKWMPENTNLRVLKPDESKRLFETKADDTKDRPTRLPFIALSRNNDIELLSSIKSSKSFDGLKLIGDKASTVQLNVIPIKLQYQLDIYTKKMEDGEEYLRNFLFKLINNPVIKIRVPYNGVDIEQKANIRVLSTVSDTSDIAQHLYPGQFTRWTIQLEIQDAFLFSIPIRKNWQLADVDAENTETWVDMVMQLEVSDNINTDGEVEYVLNSGKIQVE